MPRAFLLVFCFAAAGCHYDLHDPGTEPPATQFYFPAGIAMDPDGRHLYVSNANADLRYGGGTVQMVDLHRFECAVRQFCIENEQVTDGGVKVPGCQHHLDDGDCTQPELDFARDSDLKHVPVDEEGTGGGGNGQECQFDPLDPSVVDCDETPFIVPNAMVRVGNFAGTIRVYDNSEVSGGGQSRRLFIGVRGDPSVTYIDVHLDKLKDPSS